MKLKCKNVYCNCTNGEKRARYRLRCFCFSTFLITHIVKYLFQEVNEVIIMANIANSVLKGLLKAIGSVLKIFSILFLVV